MMICLSKTQFVIQMTVFIVQCVLQMEKLTMVANVVYHMISIAWVLSGSMMGLVRW